MRTMKLKRLLGAAGLALGLASGSAQADLIDGVLPTCIVGVTCLQFGDFNVYSLPLLNLQAGAGATPGPGDPYYANSTYGQIQNFTIIGINNGQSTNTGNPPGSIDGSFNTPSQNNDTNVTFTTLTAPDPYTSGGPNLNNGLGEFTGDVQSWDSKVSSLLGLTNGTPLTAFFAFNETGSGTGLLTTDLLVWASVTLCDANDANCTTFYLGGAGAPPSVLAGDLPAADGTDANGTNNAGTDPGFGPWVYVHAAICVQNGTNNFVGFPDVNGNCPAGSTGREQNNLGQNAAAFMINSPALDAALDSGLYAIMHITWEMAYINGGGETAWFQPVTGPTRVPEPASLALLSLGLLAIGWTLRRRKAA